MYLTVYDMNIVLIFAVSIAIALFFAIIGAKKNNTTNKPNNALRTKLSNIWNWLVNDEGRPATSSTSNKMSGSQQESAEFIRQLRNVNDNISSIDNKLIRILEQQKIIREEQVRLQQSYSSIYTLYEQQIAILSELKASMDTTTVHNHEHNGVGTNNEYYDAHSFKELYCRQLCEGKDGFRVDDLTDSPNGNCYIIKQYDDTHATLSIVENPLVRSQMITSFTNFIEPICDFDGQSPDGKDSFEVTETGELEIYNKKWLIKKKIKIRLF